MLSIESLSFHSGGELVLDALDLHVAPREIVALVGPAGAGKSVALDCIAGLRAPSTGRVRLADCDIAGRPDLAAAHLAYVPEIPVLPGRSRVCDYLRTVTERTGRSMPAAVLEAALVRGGIAAPWHDLRVADCPPAVRCKLALAAAVLKNVDVLLLDDPARELAPADVAALVVSCRRLRKRGAAILMATRDVALAERLATRLVFLEKGAVLESRETNASRASYRAHSYLAELVA
jgi:ABC-2 type transport system ATP-binding protein